MKYRHIVHLVLLGMAAILLAFEFAIVYPSWRPLIDTTRSWIEANITTKMGLTLAVELLLLILIQIVLIGLLDARRIFVFIYAAILGSLLVGIKIILFSKNQVATTAISISIAITYGQILYEFHRKSMRSGTPLWLHLLERVYGSYKRHNLDEVEFRRTVIYTFELKSLSAKYEVDVRIIKRMRAPQPQVGVSFLDKSRSGSDITYIPLSVFYDLYTAKWIVELEDRRRTVETYASVKKEMLSMFRSGWKYFDNKHERLNLIFLDECEENPELANDITKDLFKDAVAKLVKQGDLRQVT